MYIEKRIPQHKYAQARMYSITPNVGCGESEWGLISYSTIVIRVKNMRLVVTGTYSATTRKHIGWWLHSQYTHLTYQGIKKLANDMLALDLTTGEVVTLTQEEKDFINAERSSVCYGY